jgi:death-on-curing protein
VRYSNALPENKFRFITVAAVEAIHQEVLAAHGGMSGLRDRALLEAAIAAPQATYGGEALIKDVIDIGAAYLFYLCRNHPFNDGNKRTALATSLVFLEANEKLPDPGLPGEHIDEWETLILDITASRVDRAVATRRFRALLSGKKRKGT